MFEWTRKKPCWRASQKVWPNGRKCFAQVETFLNKMQKSYSQCTERKKIFPVKIYQKFFLDTRRAVEKSSLQKFLLKSFIYFSENRKKPQNVYLFFKFLLSSKLILWTQRMHFPQFYPRLLDVGLVIHTSFFSTKKRKDVAQGPKNLKKFWILSEKDFFVENVQSKCKFGNPPIVSC